MADTRVAFDVETRAFIQQLYKAWSSQAAVSFYAEMRDQLLIQQGQIDTRIATLSAVAKIVCSHAVNGDTQWDELFDLARLLGADGKSRKRAHNEAGRLQNFAIVASLWSPEVAIHYGWDTAGQKQMKVIRDCASRYPHFRDDLCPKLNVLLLQRHCQGLKHGRVKTLKEAPLQPHRDFDLAALEAAIPDHGTETEWLTNEDGSLPIDAEGTLLVDVRPSHFRLYLLQPDKYGLLVARSGKSTPDSPPVFARTPLSNVNIQPSYLPSSEPTTTIPSDISVPVEPSLQIEHLFNLDHPWDEFLFDPPTPPRSACSLDITPSASSRSTRSLNSISDASNMNQSYTASSRGSEMGAGSDVERDIEMYDHDDQRLICRPESASGDFGPMPGYGMQPSMDDLARATSRPSLGCFGSVSTGSSIRDSERLNFVIRSCPAQSQGTLTIEELLHNRYFTMIADYVERLSAEARQADDMGQGLLRAQWLNPATRWATIYTQPDGELPDGKARTYDESDVLYMTSSELLLAAQEGQVFRKPIIIKENFSDSGMHTAESLASLLQDLSRNDTLDARWLDHVPPEGSSIETLVRSLGTNHYGGGADTLNLRNIMKSHRPLFTMFPRFRLLDSLVERAHGGVLYTQANSGSVDIASCINSNVLTFPGSFSGAFLDSLSGTWMRNLDGVNFWMIVPEDDMASEWETFAKAGRDWNPNGKERLVLLEQDDVLLIPPGLRVVHALHSPTKCVMERGVIWDDLNILQTLRAVYWSCKNRAITDDDAVGRWLPGIIEEVEVLVREQPDRFRGCSLQADFLRAFEHVCSDFKSLGCRCSPLDRNESCLCRQENRSCTGWCTAHPAMADLYCMEDPSVDGNEDHMDKAHRGVQHAFHFGSNHR